MIKKSLFILTLLGLALSGYAQERTLFGIVHDMSTGRAIIQLRRHSERIIHPTFANTQRAKIQIILEQAILPGYYSDFSAQLINSVDITDPNWTDVFIVNLDKTKKFEGSFVPNFKQAVDLLKKTSIKTLPLAEAFDNALLQAVEGNGRGFFVLTQFAPNSRCAQDVFLLDLNNNSWISLSKSEKEANSNTHNLLRTDIIQASPLQQDILDARGVLIEVDNPQNPTELKVSKDGINWDRYSMNSPIAKRLWAGWNEKDIYIFYTSKAGSVLYAQDAHSPGFSSLSALRAVVKSLPGE